MTSDEHSQSFQRAADYVNNGKHDDALAVLTQLMKSDLDDFGKSMACLMGQALDSYDRGIALERTLGRYTLALRKASHCVDKDRHLDAVAACSALVASSVSEMDKANACLSAASVCEKLGHTDEALDWFDRGIEYERPHYRFNVAEHKAAYLAGKGRTKESLTIYDRLIREASMTEADKDRIRQNIHILRD